MGNGDISPVKAGGSWWCKLWNGDEPKTDAKTVLKEIKSLGGGVFREIESGKTTLLHKDLERLSDRGKKAMAIVQRGLIGLGLIKIDKNQKCSWSNFSFGIYGDQTAAAIKTLQDAAGISRAEGKDGRKFGKDSLSALTKALAANAEGKDWKEAVKPK